MARSRKKVPIFGNCAVTDKPFKLAEHRRERRFVRIAVAKGEEPPAAKEFGNPWSGNKDGKGYWAEATAADLRK